MTLKSKVGGKQTGRAGQRPGLTSARPPSAPECPLRASSGPRARFLGSALVPPFPRAKGRAKVARQTRLSSNRAKAARRLAYRRVTAVVLACYAWPHYLTPSYTLPVLWIPSLRRMVATEARYPFMPVTEVDKPVERHV